MVTRKLLLRGLLKRHRTLCLSMALVAALGISLFVGGISFSRSLPAGLYGYAEDYGYPDAVITVNAAYRASADELSALSGVDEVNCRVFANTALRTKDGTDLAVCAYSYDERNFSSLHFWSGAFSSRGVCLERKFAEKNGISAGDTVSIFLGSSYRDIRVSGIVTSPETLAPNRPDSWAAAPELGMLYFSDSVLRSTQYADLCNQFLLRLSPEADADAVLASACTLLRDGGVTVTDSYSFADSAVKSLIDDNVIPVRTMCYTVPFVFFLLVLCVLVLCVSILVHLSRAEICTLRALGFQQREVSALFSALMLRLSALGALFGLPLAFVLLKICADFYRDFFPLPTLPYLYDWGAAAFGTGLMVLLAQLASLLGCRQLSSIRPSEAQRAAVSESEQQPFLVRTLFRRASPLLKFSLTTFLRTPRRYVFSLVCTAITVIMLFSTLSWRASNEYVLSQLFDERIFYDTVVYLRSGGENAALDTLRSAGVTAEPAAYYDRTVTYNGKCAEAILVAANAGSELLAVPDVGAMPHSGIVLEQYTADLLGARMGDTVTVDGTPLTVSGISLQTTSRVQYLSLSQAKVLGQPDYSALLCRTDDTDAPERLLCDSPNYLYTAHISDQEQNAQETFNSFYFIVRVLLLFAMSIGLVIVLITTRTSLAERRREICVMRAQGFSVNTISQSFFVQSMLQFIPGLLLGMPIGSLTARLILHQILTARRCYIYASGLNEYFITAALLAAYLLLGHVLSIRSVRKWNLAESTKSSE